MFDESMRVLSELCVICYRAFVVICWVFLWAYILYVEQRIVEPEATSYQAAYTQAAYNIEASKFVVTGVLCDEGTW